MLFAQLPKLGGAEQPKWVAESSLLPKVLLSFKGSSGSTIPISHHNKFHLFTQEQQRGAYLQEQVEHVEHRLQEQIEQGWNMPTLMSDFLIQTTSILPTLKSSLSGLCSFTRAIRSGFQKSTTISLLSSGGHPDFYHFRGKN